MPALLAAVALCLVAASSVGTAQAAATRGSFEQRLDEDRWLAAFQVPGVAVALVRDGKLAWAKGYGQADTARGVPVTAQTVFQVGSISKSVTAWGVMRLVQQGTLELDAPVGRYLTRWHLPPSPYDPDGVTIGRLLSHTAGLNSQDYSPISTRPLPSLEASLAGESGGPNAREGSDDVRITMEPGRQRNYSSGGYTLLQLAIEEVTGEPFARYMQREVLDPLGMTRSSFTWRRDLRAQTASGHDAGGRAVPRSALTEQAAGGLHTTAEDIAVFVAAGMTGPRDKPAGRGVLTPKHVAMLFARHRLPDGSTVSLGYEALYAMLLAIAGALLLASSIGVALALRRPRDRRRQWIWRQPRRPGAVDWAVRGVAVAAALAAAATWALVPLRDQLATITPVRVALATSALLLLCVVAATAALTRRASSGGEPSQGAPARPRGAT